MVTAFRQDKRFNCLRSKTERAAFLLANRQLAALGAKVITAPSTLLRIQAFSAMYIGILAGTSPNVRGSPCLSCPPESDERMSQ